MSNIETFSQFYYGHTVNNGAGTGFGNNAIDFSEGGPDLKAEIPQGDYTLTEYGFAVAKAMNAVGALTYTVTIDRATRIMTISATGVFSLLCNSGASTNTNAWELMGFDTATDKTGLSTYIAENASGYVYEPQAILHEYTAPDDFVIKQDAVVNKSASGKTQTVEFGTVRFMECNIMPISNDTSRHCGDNFVPSATGIDDARDFMNYIITKAKIEFMEDKDNPGTYFKCQLEKTDESSNGTGFAFKNISKGFYETGRMIFREVIDL